MQPPIRSDYLMLRVNITLTPSPVKLPSLSRTQAMEALSLGRHPLENLLASGCLPDLRVDHVAALASRSWAASDCPLVIVRAGQPSLDGMRKIGYHRSYLDGEVCDGARQWWISNPDEILSAYPYLEAADIDEALRYAASLAEDETIELLG